VRPAYRYAAASLRWSLNEKIADTAAVLNSRGFQPTRFPSYVQG